MDALSNVLNSVRLEGAVFLNAKFTAPWCYRSQRADSVASLRARMRSLDPAQLRILIGYENAHAGRAAVLAMFERRIAKIESGES